MSMLKIALPSLMLLHVTVALKVAPEKEDVLISGSVCAEAENILRKDCGAPCLQVLHSTCIILGTLNHFL